jgi:glycosyl-4,4'-diaponeurosporenoate acyltransferase
VLIELPVFWIIALNVGGWLGIQLGFAWLFTRLPASWFESVPKSAAWEVREHGRAYERLFFVRRWKGLLPDGASWFSGGFQKAKLSGRSSFHVRRHMTEAWRGELCHWAALACTPLFFLWNPLWGDAVIVLYALAANAPCILVQRYNRARMQRVLKGRPPAPGQTRSGSSPE